MEKEKMVEEMVSIMGEWAIENRMCWNSKHAEILAKYLIGKNVLKVPEGAFVLTKEELEQRNKEIKELKIANNNLIFQLQCHDDEVQRLMKENGKLRFERDFAQKIANKKTAREILDEVSKHYGGAWLVELYKKYGVEVE